MVLHTNTMNGDLHSKTIELVDLNSSIWVMVMMVILMDFMVIWMTKNKSQLRSTTLYKVKKILNTLKAKNDYYGFEKLVKSIMFMVK